MSNKANLNAPPSVWWTMRDTASRYRYHTCTIKRLVKAGKFPKPVMVGGRPRWFGETLDKHDAQLLVAANGGAK